MRACEYSSCTQPAVRSVELRHLRAPETRHVCLKHAESFEDAGGADATRPLLAPPPAPYDRPDRVLGVPAVAVRTALASGPRTEREVREALLRPLPVATVRRALDELVAAGVALVEGGRWALVRHAEQLAAPPPARVRPRPVPVLEDEPVREPTPVVRSPVMRDPVSSPPPRPPAAPPTLRERIARWLSENTGWHAGTDIADGVEVDRGQVLSMLKRMADAGEIERFGPHRSFRYGAAGTPWPEVPARPVAAPSAPAVKPDPQVVLEVLAEHPWVTAAQLNRHGGRVLDVALSRLVSDEAVQRATWNGIRHYALPGEQRVRSSVKDDGIVHEGEVSAAAAATEDARAKVAAAPSRPREECRGCGCRPCVCRFAPVAEWVETTIVPELLTAPAPVIEESPEWGIADPPPEGVLDLGEEIGSLSFDADGSISGSAGVGVQVERDLARQTLAELVGVVRMLDRFEAAVAGEGMPPAQDPPQGSLEGVADRLAVHLSELAGFQSESREMARIQEVLSEFEAGAIAEHDGRHWGPAYQVRALLAELLDRRQEVESLRLRLRGAEEITVLQAGAVQLAADDLLRANRSIPLATARATVDSVGGQRGEPEIDLGIGAEVLTVPVTLQEMRAVAAHLWGDVIVSIFPAPVEPAAPAADPS